MPNGSRRSAPVNQRLMGPRASERVVILLCAASHTNHDRALCTCALYSYSMYRMVVRRECNEDVQSSGWP
ncbi:unnamed protein product, partial [Mycena citricolor]